MFKKILAVFLAVGLILPAGVVMAGKGPGGGGGGDIPDTGELYGDLYVILRDVNGVPILSTDGCIQPISAVTDFVEIETQDGWVIVDAYAGEPFALPTYTDTAGDLVECELAEEMATWVQAVDFGRLNLGRAPEGVIAHAFDEAINKMNVATAMSLDPAGRLILTLPDTETEGLIDKTIDSPAENLALYIKMMTDGHWITLNTDPIVKGGKPEGKGPPEGDGPSTDPRPVLDESAIDLLSGLGYANLGNPDATTAMLDSHYLTLAASLLAAAADKTGSITLDKVVYINSVYGINQAGTYFDFGAFVYNRKAVYLSRGSLECGPGYIWVIQPELDSLGGELPNHFVTQCMNLLAYDLGDESVNSVRFLDDEMMEAYSAEGYSQYLFDFKSNVRGFTMAANDALQVLEYIHNYKVPEVLYP
jgi:hypothetical protein